MICKWTMNTLKNAQHHTCRKIPNCREISFSIQRLANVEKQAVTVWWEEPLVEKPEPLRACRRYNVELPGDLALRPLGVILLRDLKPFVYTKACPWISTDA